MKSLSLQKALAFLCVLLFGCSLSARNLTLQSTISSPEPLKGIVFWPEQAADHSDLQNSISLEYSYCLPCQVVTGKTDGVIQYNWTSFENLLNDIVSRGHQAIIRFRYEYPNETLKNISTCTCNQAGATAVPLYIKNGSYGYGPEYSKTVKGDGKTFYADWTNDELKWFTKQFYTDFAARYDNDPRIAFIQVGFGHWSEYHIFDDNGLPSGWKGKYFPDDAYQSEFLQHINATFKNTPWSISIDAADDSYTPIAGNSTLLGLNFGLFDDSFMHAKHDIAQGEGWNETEWITMGKDRWKRAPGGGEISYYTENDQHNFLNPDGMYGVTWEDAAAKYHISYIIGNDAPDGPYATASRLNEARMKAGYSFEITAYSTDGTSISATVKNNGVAPIYHDAYVTVKNVRSTTSLKGLLPGESRSCTVSGISVGAAENPALTITSDKLLSGKTIPYLANLTGEGSTPTPDDPIAPAVTATPGSQNVTLGSAITPVVFTSDSVATFAVTGIDGTGLSYVVAADGKSVTVSGTPTAAGAINLSVTATAHELTSAAATATVNVTDGGASTVSDWWNFSDDDFTALPSDMKTNQLVRGLRILATSSKNVTTGSSSYTFSDGEALSNYIDLKGGGAKDANRSLKFKVNGSCTITAYAQASGSRTVVFATDAGSNLENTQITGSGYHVLTQEYVGTADSIQIFSKSSGIKFYGIKVSYSGSSTPVAPVVTATPASQNVTLGSTIAPVVFTSDSVATFAVTGTEGTGLTYVVAADGKSVTVSGTPTAAGAINLSVTATAHELTSAAATASVNVTSTTPTPVAPVVSATPASQNVTLGSAIAPVVFTSDSVATFVVTGTEGTGLTYVVAADGKSVTVSGTPTAAGAINLSVTATAHELTSAAATASVNVTDGGSSSVSDWWNFSDDDFAAVFDASGSLSSNAVVRGLRLLAASGKNMTYSNKENTFTDGEKLTYCIDTKGKGTANANRAFKFKVNGPCTIKAYAQATDARTVIFATDAGTSNENNDITGSGYFIVSYKYTGAADSIQMYSSSSAIKFYGIKVIYGASGPDAPVVTATPASQNVTLNDAITPVVFTSDSVATFAVTGIDGTGLSYDVAADGKSVTVSGTPTAAGTINISVTATAHELTSDAATATVNVTDGSAPSSVCIDLTLGAAPTVSNGGIPAQLQNARYAAYTAGSSYESTGFKCGKAADSLVVDLKDDPTLSFKSFTIQVTYDYSKAIVKASTGVITYGYISEHGSTSVQNVDITSTDGTATRTVNLPAGTKYLALVRNVGTSMTINSLCFELEEGTAPAPTPVAPVVTVDVPSQIVIAGAAITPVVFTSDSVATFSVTGIEGTGLTYDVATDGKSVTVSGAPTAEGAINISVTATAHELTSAAATSDITVNKAPVAPVVTVDVPSQIVIAGAAITPVVFTSDSVATFSVTGIEGTGLSYDVAADSKSVTVSGAPTAAGTINISVTATAHELTSDETTSSVIVETPTPVEETEGSQIVWTYENNIVSISGIEASSMKVISFSGNEIVAAKGNAIDVTVAPQQFIVVAVDSKGKTVSKKLSK